MSKEKFDKLDRRMFRVETLVWLLFIINGVKGATDLVPLVSALLSGG